jgi:hypothetical protein
MNLSQCYFSEKKKVPEAIVTQNSVRGVLVILLPAKKGSTNVIPVCVLLKKNFHNSVPVCFFTKIPLNLVN